MASGQGYNPCDLLSYGRLTQPWIFTLGRKTLTCACSPGGRSTGAQTEGVRDSSDSGRGGILKITQRYLQVLKQENQ